MENSLIQEMAEWQMKYNISMLKVLLGEPGAPINRSDVPDNIIGKFIEEAAKEGRVEIIEDVVEKEMFKSIVEEQNRKRDRYNTPPDIDEDTLALALPEVPVSDCDQECTLDWILQDAHEIDMLRDGINYMKHEKNEMFVHVDYWNDRMRALDREILKDEALLKEKIGEFNKIKIDK